MNSYSDFGFMILSEIKEMLTIVLGELYFNSAVVHQEGLSAVFGNGLTTACIVNIGAQTSTVVCVEVLSEYEKLSFCYYNCFIYVHLIWFAGWGLIAKY